MGTCLTKGFNFHSEKLREIDVSDITTFLLNLNIGKQSALSKLSNRYRGVPPIPPKNSSDLHQSHGSTWQRLGGPDPWTPLASYAAGYTMKFKYARVELSSIIAFIRLYLSSMHVALLFDNLGSTFIK